jgi:hypothetical protein
VSTFLDPAAMRQLTGFARNGKQIEVLRSRGIPFWINGRGQPVVACAAVRKPEPAPAQIALASALAPKYEAKRLRHEQERCAAEAERLRLKAELAPIAEAGHKSVVRHHAAKRRAARLLRTPAWSDEAKIRAMYAEAHRLTAETGIPHHVDHALPLQGELVSGLHVHQNLQILTAAENSRKRNKFLPC